MRYVYVSQEEKGGGNSTIVGRLILPERRKTRGGKFKKIQKYKRKKKRMDSKRSRKEPAAKKLKGWRWRREAGKVFSFSIDNDVQEPTYNIYWYVCSRHTREKKQNNWNCQYPWNYVWENKLRKRRQTTTFRKVRVAFVVGAEKFSKK